VSLLSNYLNSFLRFLNNEKSEKAITYFSKSLYIFLLLKIIFLAPVLSDVIKYLPFKSESVFYDILFVPIKLAQFNLWLFISIIISLIVVGLVIKINHYTAILIFWFSFSLSRLIQPITNGSDSVLNLFLFLAIFFNIISISQKDVRLIISNFAILFCRIQLALIYFLSGYNKLLSSAWRSGDAIYSIQNLEFFASERFAILNQQTCFYLAWVVILFEILFPILIWLKNVRLPLLILGVVFHAGIIIFLSLPDFGMLMILTYLLFYPFKERKSSSFKLKNFQSALS